MKKLLKNHTIFTALFLCLIMAATFVISPFVNRRVEAVHEEFENSAGNYNPSDYWALDGEELEQYLDSFMSNNDLTDDYIGSIEDEITEKFGDYVGPDPDTGILSLDTHYFEENFAEERSDICDIFGNVYSAQFDLDALTDEQVAILNAMLGDDTEGDNYRKEIAAVNMIRDNIALMCELADEEVGYINNNYEFVFYETNDYVQQWRLWGCTLRWNRLELKFDSDYAILFALLTLAIRAGLVGWDVVDALTVIDKDQMIADILKIALMSLPSDIAAGMVGLYTDHVISDLANVVSIALQIVGNSSLFTRVTKLLLAKFVPSIVDGVVVLYNAIYYNKGVKLTACWVQTWRYKWGFSIKSI